MSAICQRLYKKASWREAGWDNGAPEWCVKVMYGTYKWGASQAEGKGRRQTGTETKETRGMRGVEKSWNTEETHTVNGPALQGYY